MESEKKNIIMKNSILEILCCLDCGGDLHLDEDENKLVCASCDIYYPIRNGIPVILKGEKKSLN